ncbi:MAG: amino acid ABC transporter permease [Pseudotabrizicola sp.]|uniref:amino acid ABC transporter permease n=1 Tax=Paracoccaceae TaxID=31989 RepID=UPI00272FC4F0|nr:MULTISPECIES: amino acid ABC transporter permease [Paracoccaceae]MDP2081757.1 amino acid ABC transporter permease [Pseudotabrizicola sp.]MDZ4311275.1 amino acid ABC transporter permease [Cypionkella sp.]MDZ7573052.1 amino acid ABC transporter permease [Pseudotabrizicola sp.]
MNTSTSTFVRTEMLPQQTPPITEAGAVKWVRENLFSSVLNGILTVLGVAVVVYITLQIAPWLSRSVWVASSLSECRQIIADRYGEGATGACWAVIRERWPQYLFGFYPSHLYWRPVLTFALLCVAVAPVLFDKLPRQMLWFSLVYPAVGFWLLWGGSVWVPVMALAGFAIGYAAAKIVQPLAGTIVATIAAVLAPVLWWLFLAGPAADAMQSILPIALQGVRSREFGGFVLAFTIGFTGIAFSLPLGVMLALGRQSDMFIVNKLSVGFIEFIRGVPLITLLFTASLLLNYFLPPGTDFDIILRVIIMVVLFAAAYIAEVVRGGLAALPRGQYEAADALGLDYWKAQRLIIMPQALKISIPGIVSTFIGLFKDTTLVVFVGLLDPLKGITDAVRASTDWKGIYWEPYIFVGAIFFLFCFAMSRYSMYLEGKLKTDHR